MKTSVRSMLLATILAGSGLLLLHPAQASAGAALDCQGLKAAHEDGVEVETATHSEAGPVLLPAFGGPPVSVSLPAACTVTGVVGARTAADGRKFGVRFELRLPDDWNGRFFFQGGGGMDGSVNPAVGRVGAGAPALARGYAVVSMDGGHEGLDAGFASDQQARLDFAYQAVGKATHAAKALIGAYYHRGPQHAYFIGCSNGGREAMIAVQRYPLEFDGVVAGAPGFRLSRAAIQEAFANQALASIAPRDSRGLPDLSSALTDADLKLVSGTVLKACDAKDGLADGMVSHPAACSFSVRSLACRPGLAASCLAPEKARVLDAIFAGAKDSRGRPLYSRFYWDSGISEPGWRQWMLGVPGKMPALNVALGGDSLSRYFMTPAQPGRSPFDIDLDRSVEQTAQTAAINDATGTLLNSYTGHGGKLILYHGVSDPVFSAADTVDWYDSLSHDDPGGAAAVRLFLVPGMTHCGGGRATDQFDMLSAIEAWVEQGKAPDAVPAEGGPALPGVSRPLCAYPAYPRYKGGDPNLAASFTCVADPSAPGRQASGGS